MDLYGFFVMTGRRGAWHTTAKLGKGRAQADRRHTESTSAAYQSMAVVFYNTVL